VDATIVIPTKNRRELLARTLASVRALRTERSWEVVVVDDGSTPPLSPREVGSARLLRGRGDGAGAARNLGAAEARGNVLLFTDDDVVVGSDWLEAAVSFLEAHPDHVAVQGRLVSPPWDPLREMSLTMNAPGQHFTANIAYRRDAFESLGGFAPAFPYAHCEDLDLGLRAAALGQVGYERRMLAEHTPRPMSFREIARRGRFAASEVVLHERHRDRLVAWRRRVPRHLVPYVNIALVWGGLARRESRRPGRAARALLLGSAQAAYATPALLRHAGGAQLRFQALTTAEAVAIGLRRAGLGSLVERLRDHVLVRVGPFEAQIGAACLSGARQPHLAYFRALQAGRERHAVALFEAAVRPGAMVLDVGAHLGLFTQLAARRGAHVWAVEPNPETRSLLERGLERVALRDRVTVIDRAFAATTGERELFVTGGGDTSSLYAPGEANAAVAVQVVRGSDVLPADIRLNVLKLDIEGGEVAALEGLGGILDRAADDLVIFCECNPEALRAAGTDEHALIRALQQKRLEVQVIDEGARRLVPWNDWGRMDAYVNLLARRA
jgi:FkbM family methyltransferase